MLGLEVGYAESSLSLEQTELRAQLSAVRHAMLSAEMSGRISQLKVREGQQVKKGDLLVKFDCSLQQAQHEKASSQLAAVRNSLKGHERMAELNAIGNVELVNSRLEVRKAKAELAFLNVNISRCGIRAPYTGSIGDRLVREQEFVEAGQSILEIQDDSSLLLEFIVPSSWLSWLKPAHEFEVAISDTGKLYPAVLYYTAAKVDAMSQSVKVVAKIKGNFNELLPGMSGRVHLTPARI